MRAISTAVDVAAAPGAVWAVLADVGAYAEWNPLVRAVSTGAGALRVGQVVGLRVSAVRGRRVLKARVLVAHPGFEARWTGRAAVPGLLSWEHSFDLTDGGDGTTRVVQALCWRGAAVPLLARRIAASSGELEAVTEALRARVEAVGVRP